MRLLATLITTTILLWQAVTVNAIIQTYGSCTMNGLLAQCLGYDGKACRYSEYERCTQLGTLRQKINCYCKFFQNQADCWGQGRCCTEWPAHASVAKEVCNYAKLPDSQLDATKMKKMREAGYKDVVMRVCENDCQWDLPCRDDEPMPRNGQNPSGKCQPRTYWANGKCTGRRYCDSYDRIKRRELAPAAMPDTVAAA
ncbi:hypothetical protein P389DRAFT_80984 [Cystobasidium minutum MCA 4210]|uniref:uncharacterized protein n=1 Tax=Cystobasidium minutum MCA 4210 TaxID=1397322 RepID=UPI0034CECC04|eukprot:jgi/Rhomi1/80984/CE80983_523